MTEHVSSGASLRTHRSGEAGMVTAETALTMPAIILVLALVLSAVGAGVTQLRVTDTARVVARAAAAGRTDLTAIAATSGGEVHLSVDRGEFTCVTVSKSVIGPLGYAGVTAHSRACAWSEPEMP